MIPFLGVVFLIIGLVHFWLAIVVRHPTWEGVWANSTLPVSRVGNTAWSLAFLNWGIAALVGEPLVAF